MKSGGIATVGDIYASLLAVFGWSNGAPIFYTGIPDEKNAFFGNYATYPTV